MILEEGYFNYNRCPPKFGLRSMLLRSFKDWEDFSSAIFQLPIKFTLREIAITSFHWGMKMRRHFLRETVFSSTLKIYFCLFLSSLTAFICRLFSSPLLIKTSINHFKKSKNKKQRGTTENYRWFPRHTHSLPGNRREKILFINVTQIFKIAKLLETKCLLQLDEIFLILWSRQKWMNGSWKNVKSLISSRCILW